MLITDWCENHNKSKKTAINLRNLSAPQATAEAQFKKY